MFGSVNVLILSILLIALQFRLAHCRSRWPGLLLPAIHLLATALILISDSTGISLPANAIGGADGPTSIFVSTHLAPTRTIIAINIPTLIYIAVYLIQRRRGKRRHDMNKTRIQDL